MSDDGRSSAVVLEQVQEGVAQQQPQWTGRNPASVSIRHVSHFHNVSGQSQPAPASADSLRASDSLELALTQQDADPWQAVLNAAHSAKSAEAAQMIAVNAGK